MKLKRILKIAFGLAFSLVFFVIASNVWVIQSTKKQMYSTSNVSFNSVALVLGTSKRTQSGQKNRFFMERMTTAADLYKYGAVKHILVSGDNGSKYYNEPRDMLITLNDLNVPDSIISLDYAGFRTFDSIVRAKEVFGQESITIVTQEFHCYRALFIANYFGINAYAVTADKGDPIGHNLAFREVVARTVAVLDLYVFRQKPKYLGEKIELNLD